ncbi:MAG: PQQ-binding-like beta-propeller repeat protein [Thermoanaerobaculia bacterium]
MPPILPPRRVFAILAFSVAASFSPVARCATTWPQFDFDSRHSGNNTQETAIDRTSVASLAMSYQVTLPSIADGAPVYLPGVATAGGTKNLLFLTTKAGHILALDASNGSTVWSHQYAAGGCKINNGSVTCYTTSSPALDPSGAFVYSYGLDGKVHQYRVGDGVETVSGGWPETTTLKPFVEKGSSALAVAVAADGHARLYVANGGYPGDAGDYQGHVTSIDLSDGSQKVFNANCSDQAVHFAVSPGTPDCAAVQTAVWARAAVVYEQSLDHIFFATGNGDFDAGSVSPPNHDWGDSILAIRPDGSGVSGNPVDSYTPTNFQQLQDQDADLGSTAPAVLPSAFAGGPLAVQAGKDAMLRLVNLANLSGQSGPGHLGGELGLLGVPQGGAVLTHPAVWVDPADGSTWFFVANGGGISGIKLLFDGGGNPSLHSQWSKSGGGSSPVVANGVLFEAGSGMIRALNPETGAVLWTSTQIGGTHWESPIVVDGVVYVTDESLHLTAFALPTAPSGGPPSVTSFTCSPAVLLSAGGSTLTWTTSNATSVTISGVAGTFGANASTGVNVSSTTTYILTATGSGGSASAPAAVNVLPPGGASLTAPVISAPGTGQTVNSSSVGFSWGAISGADGYLVKVFGANGLIESSVPLSGAATTSAALLLPGGAHTFAVRACSGGFADSACGPFGTVSFRVSVAPPVSSAVKFYSLTPCRVADTRNPAGPYGGPALAAGTGRVFLLSGQCGIPSTAKAVSMNVTAVTPTSAGSLKINPTGLAPTTATAASLASGRTRANNAIVFLGADGAIVVNDGQVTGTSDFIIDVNGYFR